MRPDTLRAIYVSYDGALDPLGASQIIPYLLGLARMGVDLTLVTFEKAERWLDVEARKGIASSLAAAGIRWSPLRYHRRPRLLATATDIACGVHRLRSLMKITNPALIHSRGDVAALMARWAASNRPVALLYDVRGFFADERTEIGSWPPGGILDRAVRAVEARNLRRADGLVVLTSAAREILERRRTSPPPTRVVPTCVDLEAFWPRDASTPAEFGMAYCGSLGTFYMTREMVAFGKMAAQTMGAKALFLTPHVAAARQAGAEDSWSEVRSVPFSEVPSWLRRAQASFFFITASPARLASCPTKFAEALACGLPVAANVGIGDIDAILRAEGVGTSLSDFRPSTFARAISDLQSLLGSPSIAAHCQSVAKRRYDLRVGVGAYYSLYQEMVA